MAYADHRASLQDWRDKLASVRNQQLLATSFSQWARQQNGLLAALPDPYESVLLNLLDRLEAGALFTEESCSFSQADLLDSLQLWVDKAAQKLAP